MLGKRIQFLGCILGLLKIRTLYYCLEGVYLSCETLKLHSEDLLQLLDFRLCLSNFVYEFITNRTGCLFGDSSLRIGLFELVKIKFFFL